MANRIIKQVAILGSGVMGSRIACLFAGIGIPVLLLDRIPEELNEEEKQKGAALTDAAVRNRIVNEALAAAIRSNPSPLYTKDAAKLITTGNFTDNMENISSCDWIIEAVIERLDVKQAIFSEVETHRRAETLVSSNTSGIPIRLMAEGRSEDFKKHFCGTHFFNPPRYLQLLEIIPTPDTDPAVVDFLTWYGDLHLGKTVVRCEDTPAFIANRIGVYGILSIFKLADELELTIDEIDSLTGPVIGRPKSATFRTADLVGIDTLVKVADGIAENCPIDEARETFRIPAWLNDMVVRRRLGDKTGEGFFKKTRDAGGEKQILALNLNTKEYEPRKKTRFEALEAAKQIDDLRQRLRTLTAAKDKVGEFYRRFHYGLFSYVSHRIPEITDAVYRIDDAMKAGFGWEIGAFESWDALGVETTVSKMKAEGFFVAPWVEQMLAAGCPSFYRIENNKRLYYNVSESRYTPVPGSDSFVVMSHFEDQTVWNNSACRLYDLGDEILGMEWSTKANTMGGEVLEGIQRAVTIAEEKYRGLVIANEGPHFSAGANVGMIFMLAVEQEFDDLDMAVRTFQHTMMRVKYAGVPVVVAPHSLTLGGACELNLHADKICAAAETYIGLVEVGVGLIPAGGGTKEFVLRAAAETHPDEPETIPLKNRFITIATAKASGSAAEAFELGFLRNGRDIIVQHPGRRIAVAKRAVEECWEQGYRAPVPPTGIRVLGRTGLGALYAGVNGMLKGGYASGHDALVAKKLAYIMCGGDLSAQSFVSEQYLLDLEREAFLSLCGEKKSLERMQSVLKTGKPIRN